MFTFFSKIGGHSSALLETTAQFAGHSPIQTLADPEVVIVSPASLFALIVTES